MTTHENEDRLLELALGLLDDRSEKRVRLHLQHCAACRELYDDVERTLRHLKNVSPVVNKFHLSCIGARCHRRAIRPTEECNGNSMSSRIASRI